jgi:hypothetical protein
MRNFLPVLWDVSKITCVLSGLSYAINLFALILRILVGVPYAFLIEHLNKSVNCGGLLEEEWWWLKRPKLWNPLVKSFHLQSSGGFDFGGMGCCTNLAVKYKLDDHINQVVHYLTEERMPSRVHKSVLKSKAGPQLSSYFIKYPHQSRFKNMRFMGSLIGKVQYLIGCQWTVSWYNS